MTDETDRRHSNPYSPPRTSSPLLVERSLDERMMCPHCQTTRLSFMTVYIRTGAVPVRCPGCSAVLKARKHGFGKWSSFLLAVPSSVAGICTVLTLQNGNYSLAFLAGISFLPILAGTLVADYLIDRVYVELYVAQSPEEADREAP